MQSPKPSKKSVVPSTKSSEKSVVQPTEPCEKSVAQSTKPCENFAAQPEIATEKFVDNLSVPPENNHSLSMSSACVSTSPGIVTEELRSLEMDGVCSAEFVRKFKPTF